MVKRFSMVFITLILAITALLLAAKYPTGPNTVSFDEPAIMWLNAGILVVLFLLPLIFSFFNLLVLRIISAIYQVFFVFGFLGLVLVGFIIPSIWVILNGALGAIISICSIIVTILVGAKKANLVTK
ncbi:hypothetical protein [Virgibacillus sp. 6R]|uniref:hypothetical protein n=1 Tax=Metabacillus sp. 22489 TaxID=3453928 RepID=UPI0011A470FC